MILRDNANLKILIFSNFCTDIFEDFFLWLLTIQNPKCFGAKIIYQGIILTLKVKVPGIKMAIQMLATFTNIVQSDHRA